MPVLSPLPAHTVPIFSGFDYVRADAKRHRIYASHTGSQALTVIDSLTGNVLGQIDVGGPAQGVAVDPATGIVFTGNGLARTVTKVDPKSLKVLGSVDVDGPVDAIDYDPTLGRIYADEDDGTRLFVIDAKTMKSVGTVKLPGHKPEFLDIDPATHAIYQNITDLGEIAVIDPKTLTVTKTIPTAAIKRNHPLQFDPEFGEIVVAGKNGMMGAYGPDGRVIGTLKVAPDFDQCSLDRTTHTMACAGGGTLAVFALHPKAAPTFIGSTKVDDDAHTLAIDPASKRIFIVYAGATGDAVRAYRLTR